VNKTIRMYSRLSITTLAALLALVWGCTNSETAKRQYLENGNRLVAEKKYAEAILEYRNALDVDDKFGEARVRLAETLGLSGNPEGEYREYQRAADLLPDDAAVQKRAATLLFMAGQYQDVRTKAQAVLKKNPRDVEAQLLYANALVGLKDLENGVREVEDAVQLDPAHATTYTNLALLKLAQGQRGEAEAAFRKAVELDPKSLKARLALTYFDLATGDLPRAEQALKEALALEPRDPLSNRVLAALYMGTGRAALAETPLKLVAEVTGAARAKYALADYYMRIGRTNQAKAVLEPMVRDPQTYAEAQVRVAELTYLSGNREDAKKLVTEVLSRNPSHAPALLLRARWLLVEGRPVQALDRATAAVNSSPGDIAAIYLRGTLQALTGQRGAAIQSFNDVLRLNPRAVAAQIQLSQLNLRGGDAETAVGLAQEAIANNPATPEARLLLARGLVAQRELVRAEAEITILLAKYPRAPAVNALRGTLEVLKGNAAAARQAYQRAFDVDPTSIAALSGLTMLDVQERRLAEARARVEKRLVAEPKRPDLLVMAGKVYVADGNLARAEQVLREALDLAPTRPEPYLILGDIYRQQKRLDQARGEFDALAQRNSANPGANPGANLGARTMAAMLVHALGNQADAKRRYTEVLALDARAAVAANNLAWIYADEKQNLDVALELAERATDQIPDYAEAWDTLGWVYHRKQLPLLAIPPFERAIAQEPENALFHFHLGMALTGAGDRTRALESLQAALRLQPDFPDAQREINALEQ
jgi:tetratricopeptide (TPR) repeat protein